jgi:hypothetical protein
VNNLLARYTLPFSAMAAGTLLVQPHLIHQERMSLPCHHGGPEIDQFDYEHF